MFRHLFARLTGEPKRGERMFALAVAEARRPHWFLEGEVPDTVNGRFAVLATVCALLAVRLEREGTAGEEASVALTERLVESLDAEVREMGVSDPSIGKQVRRLVGAVAGRAGRWRPLVDSQGPWTDEVRRSLYVDEAPGAAALAHAEKALRDYWRKLSESTLEGLMDGRLG